MGDAGSGAARVRRIAAVGQIIDAAERLRTRDLYRDDNILRRRVSGMSRAGRWRSIEAAIVDAPYTATVVHVSSLACGVLSLAAARNSKVRTVTALVTLAGQLISKRRNPFGYDGSDQMQNVIATYDAVSALVLDTGARDDLFLRAVNAQLAVAYCASGLVKLISDDWRSGRAIGLVMRTSLYGSPVLAGVLDRYPISGKLMCWGTIAWETAYPLIYLMPRPVGGYALRFAKMFHLGIGHFMGLPRFFWAFSAAHPAAEYVLDQRGSAVRR